MMIPNLKSIDHIHIAVIDRSVSEKWYERVLGLKRIESLVFWSTNGGPLTIGNESNSVHLALFENTKKKISSTIAFDTSAQEFLGWHVHLSDELEQQVKFVDHDVSWSMYFTDPDGNPFEITCYEYDQVKQAIYSSR
ncbi:VOC family protein [Aquirhabdus parva]|nr:VOC family protein [Aquirhabdus parva]